MTEEFVDLSSVDLDNVPELVILDDGSEVELRIVSCLVDTDKNGNRYMMPFFDVPDEPLFKEFGEYIPFPHDNMSPKEVISAKSKIKNFGESFDIDFSSPIDIKNDLVGQTGNAILGLGKDREGLPVNRIKKFV